MPEINRRVFFAACAGAALAPMFAVNAKADRKYIGDPFRTQIQDFDLELVTGGWRLIPKGPPRWVTMQLFMAPLALPGRRGPHYEALSQPAIARPE